MQQMSCRQLHCGHHALTSQCSDVPGHVYNNGLGIDAVLARHQKQYLIVSVCAGVPIKRMVAGVAMGLILEEGGNFQVLTDILGSEDALGDMDFKVAGDAEGVTAFQMDIKVGHALVIHQSSSGHAMLTSQREAHWVCALHCVCFSACLGSRLISIYPV